MSHATLDLVLIIWATASTAASMVLGAIVWMLLLYS